MLELNNLNNLSVKFNTSGLEKVGIAVCDLGGEALLDNIRLFKVSDAKEVVDPYKDANGGNATAPTNTVKPIVKPTDNSGTTQPTETIPTDDTTTLPTDVVTDPTEPSQPEGEDTPSTDVDAPAPDADTDAKDEGGIPWLVIGVAVGAVALIGGVVLFLFLRKKKQ